MGCKAFIEIQICLKRSKKLQMGSNGPKFVKIGSNGPKKAQKFPSRSIQDQIGPNSFI